MYLFVIYGLFILTLLGIFFVFTYRHYQKNALEESSRDLENVCASVGNSVETQLDNLSSISMNLVCSKAIRTNFREFSDLYGNSDTSPSDLVASQKKAREIHDIITSMIGAYQNASAINLYTLDGSYVESGYFELTDAVNLARQPWYTPVMKLNGHKYISNPTVHMDLPAQGDNQHAQKFISIVRLFLDSNSQPEGIVEVIQDCGKVFSLTSRLESQNPGTSVYIYNSRHELVYPYQRQAPTVNFYTLIADKHAHEKASRIVTTDDGQQLLSTYQEIPDYDWTVVLTKPRASVYDSLNNFRLFFGLIGSLSILLTLFICFYISERLTAPLQKLTNATGKITIDRVLDEKKVNLTSADSNIKEISQLCESIRNMYEKLRSTSQEALLSRSEETRAKLQATQFVINPHFLYNCLTNISVMAEESMNADIIHMCESLCDYFRYISSSRDMFVTLDEEIFYTRCYLECMQLRYSSELEYTLDIAEKTRQYYIPKLIIQPFVENAFKYAFNIAPPWKLQISSSREGNNWILRVQDNGGTLSNEKKQELMDLYKKLDMNKELKSMQIGGMGLKNVYLRLKLLYGDKAIFKIENTLPQRTIFIFGGPIMTEPPHSFLISQNTDTGMTGG